MSEEKNIKGSDREQGTRNKPEENSGLKKEKNEQSALSKPETSNQQPAFAEVSASILKITCLILYISQCYWTIHPGLSK